MDASTKEQELRLLDIGEVADRCGVSCTTILAWRRDGLNGVRLKSVRLGSRIKIRASALSDFLERMPDEIWSAMRTRGARVRPDVGASFSRGSEARYVTVRGVSAGRMRSAHEPAAWSDCRGVDRCAGVCLDESAGKCVNEEEREMSKVT